MSVLPGRVDKLEGMTYRLWIGDLDCGVAADQYASDWQNAMREGVTRAFVSMRNPRSLSVMTIPKSLTWRSNPGGSMWQLHGLRQQIGVIIARVADPRFLQTRARAGPSRKAQPEVFL